MTDGKIKVAGSYDAWGLAVKPQVHDDCVHGDHPGLIERKVKRFVRVFIALLTFIFLISIVFFGIQHRCLLAAVLFLLQPNDEGEV